MDMLHYHTSWNSVVYYAIPYHINKKVMLTCNQPKKGHNDNPLAYFRSTKHKEYVWPIHQELFKVHSLNIGAKLEHSQKLICSAFNHHTSQYLANAKMDILSGAQADQR